MVSQETIDLMNKDTRSAKEDVERFRAVLASDKRDAQALIEAVIATKKFPWVSLAEKNCCDAVSHYYRGEYDYARYAALTMLKMAANQ